LSQAFGVSAYGQGLFLRETLTLILHSEPGKKVLAFTSVNDEINGNEMLGPLMNRDTVLHACFWLRYFRFAFESNHLCINTSGSLKKKKSNFLLRFNVQNTKVLFKSY